MTSVPPPEPQVSLHSHPEVPEGIVPAERPEPPGSLAAVPAWAPLAAMLCAFIVATIAYLLIAAVVEAGGGNVTAGGPPGLVISATLVQDVALIAAALVFASMWSRGLTPASFGLRPVAFGPAVGWTLLTFAAFWLLTAVYISAVGEPDQQELTRDLREEESLAALISYGVLLTFIAPLCEELFFRGFVFGVLREKVGVAGGAIATGVVFGLVHVSGSPIETVGVLVILGVLLCLLFAQTGSLLPCIALHAINNAISFAATKEIAVPAAILIVLAAATASIAVSAAVMRRAPALPGAPRTR
jgi:membrane protease YdiL (CAAX protease family)